MTKKTKLLISTKDQLCIFARDNVATPKETKSLEAKYKRVLSLVIPVVEKVFPPEEMAILKKYGQTSTASRIDCMEPQSNQYLQMDFLEADEPVIPRNVWNTKYVISKAAVKAIEAWELAADQQKEAKADLFIKYKALIMAARNAEDVLAVWPAAKAILDPFIKERSANQYLPVAVSPELIQFIKKNNAGAAASQNGGQS